MDESGVWLRSVLRSAAAAASPRSNREKKKTQNDGESVFDAQILGLEPNGHPQRAFVEQNFSSFSSLSIAY